METLIIKAKFRGEHDLFEKLIEYHMIVTKLEKGWQLMTIDDNRIQHYYHNLKEFIEDWTNISNI